MKSTANGSATPGMMVLATLILGAAVAKLNLSVANVALPSIGLAFDASYRDPYRGRHHLL